jgi:hypothetical protein
VTRTIRFHFDENVNGAIAQGLRLRGVDVTTTAEAGLRGKSDLEQLAHATAAGRMIVTEDDDYLGIHASGVFHAGIGFFDGSRRTIGQVIVRIMDIWNRVESDDVLNKVEYL